ncbi:MAG: hypothetical protein AABW91_00200 [Nanoarchaeota archaeon]
MDQERELSFKEEAQIRHALIFVVGERAKILSRESRSLEEAHSEEPRNNGICSLVEEGCICVRNREIYNNVCNGRFNTCPGYVGFNDNNTVASNLCDYKAAI